MISTYTRNLCSTKTYFTVSNFFLFQKRMDATFRKRLKRRLHYGDMTDLDAPSLPLTGE